jgi:tetratricopeptide (TPR) repeat protein
MNWIRLWKHGALALALGVALSGCTPSSTQVDEEREPHFLEGKSRVSSMDYQAAVQSFEEALEVNPHSAAAHFELACLFTDKEPDPAAAIYHYQSYLKLRPDAGNADLVKGQIIRLKQDIAREVDLPADTPEMQREMEKLMEENRALRDEVDRWRAGAGRAAIPTNGPPNYAAGNTASYAAPASPTAPSSVTGNAASTRPAGPAAGARTYKVQAGDTPAAVARKYGFKLDALLAANPGLNPTRMKVGQVLNLPAQ